MSPILVAGLINIETTLKVDGFPIGYSPVRYPFFGVKTTVSGVGYNVAKALTTLGNRVNFCSLVGQDAAGMLVKAALAADGIASEFVLDTLDTTAQSVILYDGAGRRQINTDLKDIQQRSYPPDQFDKAMKDCALAVLCNINFSRPFLQNARRAGLLVATDVHTIAAIDDDYNQDYMTNADILFMSHERLPCAPEAWVQQLLDRYGNAIIVIGLGADGALLAVRDHHFMERVSAVFTRPIVNTIGGGDALFSAFVHTYNQTGDPYAAIKKAMVFASYKIGATGAADGFLDADQLDALVAQL
jgi:ribokinase